MKRLGLNIIRAAILVNVAFLLRDVTLGGPALLDGVLTAVGVGCFIATFIDWGDREPF